jgi:dTDP-4-amino-4,6-dideoxygalactose transaminase
MDHNYIPFHRPSIGDEEISAVNAVLTSKWLTTGPVTQQFEAEFAAYVGARYAIAVNSATAALQLAMDAIGLKAGDEVLVPSYTFTATAEVVTYFGAHPVLCDSVAGGLNIDPLDAARKITERTKAIIPVHVAGEACDLDTIHALARPYRLYVVEDAAHALPATVAGRSIGSISDLTAFSFYATKTITTGEGGMLTTDNEDYARRASMMRLHGISGDAWKRYSKEGSWYYEVVEAGYKLNMPDILAALGREQLKKADAFWRRRCEIAQCYAEAFSKLEEFECPPAGRAEDKHSWHLFILRLRRELLEVGRSDFVSQLRSEGIGTSVHFIPLHRHPFYKATYGCRDNDFTHAEDAFSRCLSLPIFPDMSEQEVERVIHSVVRVGEKNRKKMWALAS